MTNILARMNDIENLKAGMPIMPGFVDFHTSDACNMNCAGCAYKGRLTGEIMPEEKHFQAVDMFMDRGVRAFDFAGGGEPTMLPYLGGLMRHIGERDGHFGLITNGLVMAEDVKEALLKYGTYVRYSLETVGSGPFGRYKGAVHEKDYPVIVESIKAMVERRNGERSDLEISLKFSVGLGQYEPYYGIDKYLGMLGLGQHLGVDRVNIKRLVHEPCEIPLHREGYEIFSLNRALEIWREGRNDQKKFAIHANVQRTKLEDVPYCWLSPVHTVMDHKGNIYICCYYYYRDNDFFIGNIFDQSFDEIWFGEVHREKLKKIDRYSCAKVDCKFFAHHKAVDNFFCNGKGRFL